MSRNESYQRRKNQTLPHPVKIDDRKNIVKINDVCAKELHIIKHAKRVFPFFPIISFDRSCFSCLYRENNYICNSLGKYKRTIFIERSENVNIEMCVQHILYHSFKIFYKFFVKKEKTYKKNYGNVYLFHEIFKEIFLQSLT